MQVQVIKATESYKAKSGKDMFKFSVSLNGNDKFVFINKHEDLKQGDIVEIEENGKFLNFKGLVQKNSGNQTTEQVYNSFECNQQQTQPPQQPQRNQGGEINIETEASKLALCILTMKKKLGEGFTTEDYRTAGISLYIQLSKK